MQRHDPCKIFVRGINPQLSDADVLATFAVHGEILRYTKSLKKEFAFVTFDDPESAYNARTRVARVAGHPVECRQAWVEWGPNAEEHTVHKRPHSSRSDFGAGGLHRLDAPGSTFAPKVPRRLRRGRNPTEAGLGDLRAEERAALRDQLGGGRQQGGGDDRSAERDSGWSSRQKRGGRRESDRGYEEKKSGGKHEDGGGSKGGKRERGREEKRDSHGRRSQVGRSRSRSPQRSGRRDNYYDYPPPSHRRRRSNSPRSPRFSPASPALPSFSPASPVFSPAAPSFSPTSPRFSLASSPHRSPTSPRFSPASPRYSPTSPRFSPAEISYSPASPSFSPGSPVPRARAPHMDHPQPSSSQLPAMPSESGFDAQDLTTRLEGAQEPTTVSGRASSDHREPSNQPVTRDSTLTPLSDLEARRSATPMDAEPEAQLGDSTEPQTSVETVTEEENEQNAEDAVEQGSGSKGGFKKGSFVPVENEKGARSGRGGQHGGGRDEEEDEVNGEDGRGGGRDGDERSASGHGGGRRRDSEREGFIDEHCRLAVRNLSKVCTSDSLRSFAAECGRVGAVSVHLNFIGEGMLEYSTMAEADEALRSLNGRPLHGMAVRLERY